MKPRSLLVAGRVLPFGDSEPVASLTIEQFERVAEDVREAYRSADSAAMRRINDYTGERLTPEKFREDLGQAFGKPKDADLSLAEAQAFVARAHGVESWPELAKHVDDLRRGVTRCDAVAGSNRPAKPPLIIAARFFAGLSGPSKTSNARTLRERGENAASLAIRDATPADIPALADLHVKTWNATYAPFGMTGPSVAIREWQWREAFAKQDHSWFCLVIEGSTGELVGFAKGIRNADGSGELNKIYLLLEYQRLGLGRRLVGHVARRFLDLSVTSMGLFADGRNPSCWFYEALGAENPREPDGRVNYSWYVWRDLPRLASLCPVD